MSDKHYHQTSKEMGTDTVDDKWLIAHAKLLSSLPVYAPFGWGWSMLMATDHDVLRQIRDMATLAYDTKPMGCELCEEKPATMYHPYAGRVCPECHATLPKE